MRIGMVVLDEILGGYSDGYDHRRDTTGFCVNCGAVSGEVHYQLRSKNPIYTELVKGTAR